MPNMTIGELSRSTGFSIDTIRFYERVGVMPPPRRRASGYRVYTEDDVRRLNFVRRAKEVGFSLREIRELLQLRVDAKNTCEDVRKRSLAKIAQVEKKIEELHKIKRALHALVLSCDDKGPEGECPILAALEDPDGVGEHEQVGMVRQKHSRVNRRRRK